jgi:hypothetical protein
MVREFPCRFPCYALPNRGKRMCKYLIKVGFLAAGRLGLRPGNDFFPDFSLPAGKNRSARALRQALGRA